MKSILQAKTPIGVTSGIEQKIRTDMAYVTSFAITTGSKKKDAAWTFLKYITSKEAQTFLPAQGLVPMRRDVTLIDPYKEMLTGFINAVTYSTPYPYHIHSNYIQDAINSGMAAVWNRTRTPEAVVPELQRSINAYLEEQKLRK